MINRDKIAFKILALACLMFLPAIAAHVQAQSERPACQSIDSIPNFCFVYNASTNTTMVAAPLQRLKLRQNDSSFEVEANFIFLFAGTIKDLEQNPGIAKQYNLILHQIPLYRRDFTRARFALLKVTSPDSANIAKLISINPYEQTRREKQDQRQTIEMSLGDILDYLILTGARNAEVESSLGTIELSRSDLKTAGELIKYVSALFERQLKNKSNPRRLQQAGLSLVAKF